MNYSNQLNPTNRGHVPNILQSFNLPFSLTEASVPRVKSANIHKSDKKLTNLSAYLIIFLKNLLSSYPFIFKLKTFTFHNTLHHTHRKEVLTACLIVRGKPSRMKPDSPFAALAWRRLDSKSITISSETNLPWLTTSASCKKLIAGK